MTGHRTRRGVLAGLATAATVAMTAACAGAAATPGGAPATAAPAAAAQASSPIKHVVVLFGENISFDHYFGTYPKAAGTDGTPFTAAAGTPKVNGLTPALTASNPNRYPPMRLSHEQAVTCDQSHDYDKEQKAYDGGKVDKFVESTEKDTCTGQPKLYGVPGIVMGHYDGNTVTALWNYAQHYAMSDDSFGDTYGPSSPGAVNLIAGTTGKTTLTDPKTGAPAGEPDEVAAAGPDGTGTMIGDPDPALDECSNKNRTTADPVATVAGRNVGDLLNEHGVTWGWFQGGFAPTGRDAQGAAVCGARSPNAAGIEQTDYSPHHEPFQYYRSTANPQHLPPSSPQMIGRSDQANHQYDLSAFGTTLRSGSMPAVSFIKAKAAQDGHAANSDPLSEQQHLAGVINEIQKSPEWASTAIFVAYDDSDGWYDHVMPPVVNGSQVAGLDSAACSTKPAAAGVPARCGYGPRLPLMVISPYSRVNYVDHGLSSQSSIRRFVQDNWGLGTLGPDTFDATATPLTRPDGMFDFTAPPHPQPLLIDPRSGAVTRR